MAFQIKNKEGKAIAINELDKEAAEFWGKEVHKKNYANPVKDTDDMSEIERIRAEMSSNWFDIIGWCIHSQGNACSGWPNVVATMIAEHIGMKFIDTSEGYQDRPIVLPQFVPSKYLNAEGEERPAVHLPDKLEQGIYGLYMFYEPFIDLINHWQAKGYTPHKVED